MNKSKIKTLILAVALTVSMSSVSLLATTNVFADETEVTSQRLWGNDRYETAVEVSKSGFTTSDTVILVRGDDFADALAVTPLAKMYNAPILLTGVNFLPASVQAEITRLGATKIVIAGGIGAVSQTVENSLKKLATVERISGSDRYATSVKIAEKLGAKTSIALVTGLGFADGESIAAVAAQMGMPVIFTTKNTLSTTAKDYIKDNKVTKTYVIGGNGVISDSVAAAVPGMERLSGADRYDTNLSILNKFSNQINFDGVYVATGADFADALTTSALAAKNSQAVVLASKSLTAANVSFIKGQITPKTVVTLIGGEKIVPSAIATSLTLDKTDYATDGKTYSAADIKGKNINLTGKDMTVDGATINGNLYVYGNGTKLSNTTVNGTIFLDPGLTGDVTLKNVKASRIVVQSGAASSINLDSVTADVLVSQSANSQPSTRIHATGTTAIGATEIQSDIFLNCESGSFGTVSVTAGGTSSRNLQLAGIFTPIHLTTPCNFSGTATPTVYVDAPGVIVSGKIGDLVINTTTAPEFAPGTVIERIIGTTASKGIVLTIPAGVTVTKATSDFVLAGTGASGIVVIPPTTVGETTPPVTIPGGVGGGGNGGNGGNGDNGDNGSVSTKTISGSFVSSVNVSLDKIFPNKTIDTSTLLSVYYEDHKNGETFTNLLTSYLPLLETNTIDGQAANIYISGRLLLLNTHSTLGNDLNPMNIPKVISDIQGKTFADFQQLIDLFITDKNGIITLPVSIKGTSVTYSVKANNKTILNNDDNSIDLVDALNKILPGNYFDKTNIMSKLGALPISAFLGKTVDIKVTSDSTTKYSILSTDGITYTITRPSGVYTFTIN